MDLNIVTLSVITYISDYDYYDSLTDLNSDANSKTFTKLGEIRERNKRHTTELFPNVKFRDSKNQLLAIGSFKQAVKAKIETLSKKEIEDYLETFKKDAKKMARFYRKIRK
ncbi:hypothetical protein EZ456_15110 [Pedobacter psychrodurus]|uniref:Uncharacterized protein n=1 Tax=Pedobacter psychrodurus TaxID=2530456 RepID=A0A4R0Q0F4_9SPHI|nr:hypothetical protein [Pedobacter psychrodurus]TCD25586.1 hypothetical protein EZ456_15110 [Pedobacter psychrodurus]